MKSGSKIGNFHSSCINETNWAGFVRSKLLLVYQLLCKCNGILAFDYTILEGDFTLLLNLQLLYHIYILNFPRCLSVAG